MTKTYNFCAGPAMIPEPVMKKAQAELINWNGLGTSVMEVSHRDKPFLALAKQAEIDLRELMNIPDNYHVFFMHGGGRAQFAAVVNNFLGEQGRALYLISGQWSQLAADEAKKLVPEEQIDTVSISNHQNKDETKSVTLPDFTGDVRQFRYLHYCPNETVDGIEIFDDIDSPWPIIADMSSNILSRDIDVSKFAVIYAGAQKNIGPSGLSIAIVREDMLQLPSLPQPTIFSYQAQLENNSMYNTPPTFAWYLAAEVFKWLKQIGGVSYIEKINRDKAELLYAAIDASDNFYNDVASQNRSLMNVTFHMKDKSKQAHFLTEAESHGLVALKGHRFVGGLRASIYNAMSMEGVNTLAQFIKRY
ncbi:3-phosphoserine/phosphohydroxythreonine transaminase [Parashewanella curva]|uniref:Phosphoserine aminotransferase n=1 Tax=Parashewanella curva TaxID=2338552 RepID=A0A3L8Q2R8_9GAMM|nr:3-phosphoserine/phosphohydroxythreonine transaminase [Parashewanella curva]RLV61213.1 3-phosphoserine/phosphohydroxythreonine transaminase [Parashewanella curva]